MKRISKNKFDRLMAKAVKPLLADMRSPVSFRDGHIENAVKLPLKNFVNKIMALPRYSEIVMYSTTISDVDLVQGINYAEQLGFKKLYVAEFDNLK